ncbi:hypothetical protein, partial [Corynebacterium bovis]|uniref:hypothetical protein n=1 Tax=Corynebacterium bovis TaxID=36808 RepID=UPI0002192EFB
AGPAPCPGNAARTSPVSCSAGPYVAAATEKSGPKDAEAWRLRRSSDHPHFVPVTPGRTAVP